MIYFYLGGKWYRKELGRHGAFMELHIFRENANQPRG